MLSLFFDTVRSLVNSGHLWEFSNNYFHWYPTRLYHTLGVLISEEGSERQF
jgi:hypothetical protein